MAQCVPVISSWVRYVILTAGGELAVQFYDKKHKRPDVTCLYPGTTASWFMLMLAAPSKGKWVHAWLYKKRPYLIVRPPCGDGGLVPVPCCPGGLPATVHA